MTLLNFEQKILFNKALELHNKGKIQDAINLYFKLIKKNKNNFELLFLIGTAYAQSGKTLSAIKYLKNSLILKPNNALAHSNLGNALKDLKQYGESIASYDKAINIDSNFADVYSNRGIALKEMGRLDEAVGSYNKAIKIKPDHFFAYSNRGIALRNLNRFEEAIASFDKAIQINPNFIDAFNNRGNVYNNLKLYDEALSDYERVMQLKSSYDYILGKVLQARMFSCDWRGFDSITEKINGAIKKESKAIVPFSFLGVSDNPAASKLVSEIFVKDKLSKNLEIQPLAKYNHKKPKIGYFSGDFHNHPILHLMMEVFENHNRSKFDFFGFSFGPDKRDKWRNEVQNYFLQFKDISKISDKQAANLVRDLEIDIAIDLSGFTENGRSGIFSYRAAPIQINYLGYPGTTGLEYMDYIIADDVIIPKENLKYYSENVLHLPQCYQANVRQRDISTKEVTRGDFGLPEKGIVYCNFNNNYKITPYVFNVWMNIIKRVDNSVLWILKSNDTASKNLKNEAIKNGVDPSRIIFAPHLSNDEHLKRISLADLFLDTFPYNAHTTASEAVRMGTPIITWFGKSFASRVGASILSSINMKELITNNKKDYEELAVVLGTEPKKLNELKNRFRDMVAKSSLFDRLKFTKNLENLYLKLLNS